MALAWNPGAIPGFIALVTGLSMAGLVYWTRPDRSQNRRLALLRLQEDLGLGAEAANRIEADVIDGSPGGVA